MIENVVDNSIEEDHLKMESVKEVVKISTYEEDRNIALRDNKVVFVIGKKNWNMIRGS